ncbi:hypothetical protein WISP_19667 [Willisornis vidua]|uniref:Uncharacterized protein n=1 Tax=Willisornis vidua TaxID=1566151 RepID=A0ABQ9DUN8_9PASS|nr:hypothetical protein WISP_19667 [Willisornis vidua]
MPERRTGQDSSSQPAQCSARANLLRHCQQNHSLITDYSELEGTHKDHREGVGMARGSLWHISCALPENIRNKRSLRRRAEIMLSGLPSLHLDQDRVSSRAEKGHLDHSLVEHTPRQAQNFANPESRAWALQ